MCLINQRYLGSIRLSAWTTLINEKAMSLDKNPKWYIDKKRVCLKEKRIASQVKNNLRKISNKMMKRAQVNFECMLKLIDI